MREPTAAALTTYIHCTQATLVSLPEKTPCASATTQHAKPL